MDNQLLLEKSNVKVGVVASDFQTAKTGARISLQPGRKVAIIVAMDDSTGAAVTLSLKQHNAASGGTTKALSVDNPYFKKVGTATKFTKVEQSSKEDAYDLASDFAAEPGVVVFEIHAQDLDVNNGFSHVSLDVAAAGVAKLGSVLYVLHDLSYKPGYDQDL